MEGLDNLGLNREEQKLLAILAQEKGKPVRLNSLAMMMGTLPRNISQTIEPYLFRAGLITKDDKGRTITPKGYKHIMTNSMEQ
jgi:Holliday junction DNA helicase RuvB